MSPLRRLTLPATVLLLAVALVSCSASPEPSDPAEPETTPQAPIAAPSAEPEEEPDDATDAEDEEDEATTLAVPTCDEMLFAGTRDRMMADGWSPQEEEFRFGPTLIEEGIICSWSDFEEEAEDGQFFGWAVIDDQAARDAQEYLVGEGWLRENAAEGVYITERPEFAFVVDDDGYGITYFFGDGWVTIADVRQNLALIDWNG